MHGTLTRDQDQGLYERYTTDAEAAPPVQSAGATIKALAEKCDRIEHAIRLLAGATDDSPQGSKYAPVYVNTGPGELPSEEVFENAKAFPRQYRTVPRQWLEKDADTTPLEGAKQVFGAVREGVRALRGESEDESHAVHETGGYVMHGTAESENRPGMPTNDAMRVHRTRQQMQSSTQLAEIQRRNRAAWG